MELNPHTDKKMFWEHKLMELLNKDNEDGCTVHFEYSTPGANDIFSTTRKDISVKGTGVCKNMLQLKTYNPKKDAMFLMMETMAGSEGACAELAYQELIHMRGGSEYKSYTLEWHKKDGTGTHMSHFYAKTELDVLTKFYFEMGPENVVFYSLKVNPIS